MTPPTPTKRPRGFAAMSPEARTAIARKGGAAVPPEKRAYSTNRELAAASGSKGGTATQFNARFK